MKGKGFTSVNGTCLPDNVDVGTRLNTPFFHDRFKLFLEPPALRDPAIVDPRLPALPVCSLICPSRSPDSLKQRYVPFET